MKHIFQRCIGRLSPLLLTHILYYKTFHKVLNLKNPQTLNEKIHWMKFYGDTSQWKILADKYRVREYVQSKGLGHILVHLYGKWDHVEDIDWDSLPNKFVLKVNNGCGDILICHDKNKLDINKINKKYSALLKETFGITTGQSQYKNIPPCIIAEELLDANLQASPSSSLIDYKIWCFNGKPAYFFVFNDRNGCNANCMVYDLNWNPIPDVLKNSDHYKINTDPMAKPVCLNEMIKYAEILSEGHPEMRVDLYEVNGKVYFGELTMSAACGFMNNYTPEFMEKLGQMIILPNKK